MDSLTSECYDGTSIVTTIIPPAPGDGLTGYIEVMFLDTLGVQYDHDIVAYPQNSVNPEDHLAFAHREAWRDYNERKL